MKILRSLCIIAFLCILSNNLIGQDCHTGKASVWIPSRSYNSCTGELKLTIHTWRFYGYVNYTTTVNSVNVTSFELLSISTTGSTAPFDTQYKTFIYRVPSHIFNEEGKIHVHHSFTWADCGSGMSISFDQKDFDADPANLILSEGQHCNKICLLYTSPSPRD